MFAPHMNETANRKQEAREEQGNKPWGAAVAALHPTHKRTQEIKGLRGRSNFRPPEYTLLRMESILMEKRAHAHADPTQSTNMITK